MRLLTELYPYQSLAVEKLIKLKVGALYMEMGTGKTRTTLELIFRRIQSKKIDRALWLCPCSVKQTLRSDIIMHSDGVLPRIAIAGIESLSASSGRLFEVLDKFVSKGHAMIVVDESNLVKNPFALRTRRITALAEKCLYRMILNGTPISKTEADLYAQWYILDWRILGYRSYWMFERKHLVYEKDKRNPKKKKLSYVVDTEYLTNRISPYSYMVRKDQVLELPDKWNYESVFQLTLAQEEHYSDQMMIFLNSLIDLDDSSAIYRTFTVLQQITSGRRIVSDVKDPLRHVPFFKDPRENPRIDELLWVLEKIERDTPQSKVIIWCRFQHEIDDIAMILSEMHGEKSVVTFTGKASLKKRDQAIERFRGASRFFVANKQCAGYGLNLQFCHVAVYYNNDWNWATRVQSEDRIHRIGQNEPVKIYDIVCDKGIDQKIMKCLGRKENLADSFRSAITGKNARQWLLGQDETADELLENNKKS